MPSAIPTGASTGLPPPGMIDPRGHRFGAAVSAALLVVSFLTDAPIGPALVLLTIGTSAAFGMRWSVYGMAWRRLVRVMRLRPVEMEHEYPPRFAETLGSVALVLALVALGIGATAVGWLFALAVAALQTLLGLTGYCLGCRLYFLRWWVPSFVTRIWSRGASTAMGAAPGGGITYR